MSGEKMKTYGKYSFRKKLSHPMDTNITVWFRFFGVKNIQILVSDRTGFVRAFDEITPEEAKEMHYRLGLMVDRMKEKGYLREEG